MALLEAPPPHPAAGWEGLAELCDDEGGPLRPTAPPREPGAPADDARAVNTCWTDLVGADFAFVAPSPGPGVPGGAVEQADDDLLRHAEHLSFSLLPPPVDTTALRCLDPAHGADCSRCTAPPAHGAAKEAQVRLYSQGAGAVAGEKLLRRLLLACPEWSNAAAREAAASAAEAEGDFATASCVRARSSPALRKGSMLALCRHWRYRCDVFTPSPLSAAAHAQARGSDKAADDPLGGSSAGEPLSPSAPANSAAPSGETHSAHIEAVEGAEWRCLDESHPPGCSRCSRPPASDAAAAACVLRGSRKRQQHQNGEKQLRAALCRTVEWRDPVARAAAARRLADAGAHSTARAVAERDCSALRKLDMLRLCRVWRRRSDVWQARAELPPQPQRQPARPRAAQQPRLMAHGALPPHLAAFVHSPQAALALEQGLPGGPVAPPPPHMLDVRSVHVYLRDVVAPPIRSFLYHGSVHSLYDIEATLPPDTPSATDAEACKRSAAVAARMHGAAAADLARLRACVASLDGSVCAAPASCLGTLAPALAEGHVHMLRLFASGMAEHVALMESPTHGIAAREGRPANAMELRQCECLHACHVALLRVGSAMQALLLHSRDADAATYLAAGCGVLDLISELARLTVLNELGRADWAAGRPCSWRASRFFGSLAAVSGEMMPHRMHAAPEATAPAMVAMPPHHRVSAAVGLAPFYFSA